ncbi:MAG: 23S rRNA (uracil(1939)-C(5))-methyltransferase RlmD [Chlorobi bacterium]|nr:23S rRNA (uracil(1939)-C(5))-methyltransferase RlmD [Chlorobiota bacterium]
MKPGELLELDVESLGFEGIAIARLDTGIVVQLRGGLPGERVRARIRRKRRSYIEGDVVEVIAPSPWRREPPCPYAGDCGGCTWQHAEYTEQARWKQQHVRDALERIAGVVVGKYHPLVVSPLEFGYRAKMEFSCSERTWIPNKLWESMEPTAMERKRSAIGLHVRGRFDAVLDIEKCLLQDEVANAILAAVRQRVRSSGVLCYNQRTREGFLRNIIIRRTSLNEAMLVLVTTSPQHESDHQLLNRCAHELPEIIPQLVSIIWAVNDTPSPVPPGPYQTLTGREYIRERLAGVEFRISAQSFFQANIPQLERFVACVIEAASLEGNETLWDLYAGAGTLTLPLARKCTRIIGVESNVHATTDARANAERNGITNAEFITIDLHSPAGWDVLDRLPQPDVVITDPPRAGMHPKLVEYLLRRKPQRIVYVSCNPATQARDVELLTACYHVTAVQPIDMFPQTYHVESIAVLQRYAN